MPWRKLPWKLGTLASASGIGAFFDPGEPRPHIYQNFPFSTFLYPARKRLSEFILKLFFAPRPKAGRQGGFRSPCEPRSRRGNEADSAIKPIPPRYLGGYYFWNRPACWFDFDRGPGLDSGVLASAFDFSLPPELIAQAPASARDHARLLVLRRPRGETAHR